MLREKINALLPNAYGIDHLSVFILRLAAFLLVIDLMLSVNLILLLLIIALLAFVVFRAVSRDVAVRRSEEELFIRLLGPAKSYVLYPFSAVEAMARYKQFSCPSCQRRLRVPRGKGRLRVNCPECKTVFELRS